MDSPYTVLLLQESPSGRARCRKCRKPIPKGVVRVAARFPAPFGDEEGLATHYLHLRCAARRTPGLLVGLLDAGPAMDVGDPDALRELARRAEEGAASRVELRYPYVEQAPNGKAKCYACGRLVVEGSHRLVVLRTVDAGRFTARRKSFLHAACAAFYGEEDRNGLPEALRANSPLTGEALESALEVVRCAMGPI
ncbi:MAG: hypothetical protein HY722_04300 [Planctomycetes bacterium]|nr:hypothetical protein [Planctomycetota bacterium]